MESSNRIKLSLSKKLKEYANKMGRDHLGGDDIPGNKKKGGLRDNDGYDNVQYNRDMPQDESVSETTLFGEFLQEGIESVNEGKVDRVVGHTRYKYVGDGRKGQAIVSGPMKDREKEAIIKRAKKAGYNAKPNMGGGVTIHVESVNEATSKYPNFDLDKNIRYQSTSISKGMWRYTGKEQGGKGVYRNLNNNQFLGFSSDDFKYFKKHLKRHFDIDESVIDETAKRDYKDEYKKFQSSTKSKKYRAELNKYNRDKGTYGNGDNKDASHKGGKIVGFESQSKNRGRAEKSRLKKK